MPRVAHHLERRCFHANALSTVELYDMFHALGLQYGPRFRPLNTSDPWRRHPKGGTKDLAALIHHHHGPSGLLVESSSCTSTELPRHTTEQLGVLFECGLVAVSDDFHQRFNLLLG